MQLFKSTPLVVVMGDPPNETTEGHVALTETKALTRSILGVMGALLLAGATMFASSQISRIEATSALVATHGERLAKLEQSNIAQDAQIALIRSELSSISVKLDRLLGRG